MRPPLVVAALIVGSAACAAPRANEPRAVRSAAATPARAPVERPSVSRPAISGADLTKIAKARSETWDLRDKSDEAVLALANVTCDLASWSGPEGRLDDDLVAAAASTSLKIATALETAFCPEVVKARRAEASPPPTRVRPPLPILTPRNRIRALDLRNTVYPVGTCRAPNWKSMFPVEVIDGRGESGSREDGSFTAIEVEQEPQYGDIDGDGIEDVVQEVACNGGGLHVETFFVPLTLRGGRLEILGGHSVTAVAADDLGVRDARVSSGGLRGRTISVLERVPADDDEPRCCYSGRASVSWWWNGRTFVHGRARKLPSEVP